jgi:hypothetical protein
MKTRYAAKVIKDAARACNKTARADCIETAKTKLHEVGISLRKFRGLKSLADIRGAAETWVGCMEANESEADIQQDPEAVCENLTKATLGDLSGSKDMWQALRDRVLKLGKTLLDGKDTLIEKMPALDFEALSDALDCSNSTLAQIKGELLALAKRFSPKLSKLTDADPNSTCRIVFGRPTYKVSLPTEDMNETEIELLAVKAAGDMTGLDYQSAKGGGGRRLQEVIMEAYAAQASSEVPADEADLVTTSSAPQNGTVPQQCVPFHLKVQNPNKGCEECTSIPCAWIPCTGATYPICTSATSQR